ncbi:hypothetical protein [uncultured Clostridium sp.]|uniref:hypothetical protein n=1 Tax=uncultured Clostridium sp. TaxID=59620 RepID=UPI00261A4EC9|nr:hypothetical protein [uncultured Clostridium sp.]
MNYILSLEVEEGLEIINKAFEKDMDEFLWQRWLVDYRGMDEKTFIGFTEYKDKLTGKNIVKDSKMSYLEEAEKIRKKSKKSKEVNDGNI